MAEDLKQAINRHEVELKTTGEARAKFHETILRMKNSFRKDISTNPRERPVWEELLKWHYEVVQAAQKGHPTRPQAS